MSDDNFPPINRGNGVLNDNIATLGDIMLATHKGMKELKEELKDTKVEVKRLKNTIQEIDKKNTPREVKSLRLLIASVLIGVVGLVLAYLVLT